MLKIKNLMLIGILCLAFQINAQVLLTDTSSIKYFPAKVEPSSNWKLSDFDDSNWNDTSGLKLLGYGDTEDWEEVDGWSILGFGDVDYVEIPKSNSLYVRSFFNVEQTDTIKEVFMYCDFDDGFVAYLNGVEFARVNMGKHKTSTTYNQLTLRSHDMACMQEIKKTWPVMGYYIDSLFLDSVLNIGRNVLSIEVHNDSINGADLGFYHQLLDITKADYVYGNEFHRYKKCIELETSKLPIFIIETDEYGIPYSDNGNWEDVHATIKIINNDNGSLNNIDSKNYEHAGDIKLRYRGQSSRQFLKRPYKFELKDEEWNDTSISLLGLPKEEDWILQGPYSDKSQIRNSLVYEFGRKTGWYAPRTKFIELVINGEYVGLYNLVEQIKRDSGRVNIAKLRDEEISGIDLTGGYIFKYDKPSNGKPYLVYPKEENIQDEQETYIKDFLAEYDEILYSNNGLDPNIGYKKYIDEESLIDYVIISDLAKNADSYRYSTYLYKDKNDRDPRIKFGPLWDFDLGFGNTTFQKGNEIEGWQFEFPGSNKLNVKRLFEDTELVEKFQNRWFELRESFLHTDSIFARIDELRIELEPAIKRNYEIWPVIDDAIFYDEGYVADSYEEEIAGMKDWIRARANWIDQNITELHYDVTDYTSIDDYEAYLASQFRANIYPNPAIDHFVIDLNMPNSGMLEVEIFDISGKAISVIENTFVDSGNYKVFWRKGNENIWPGLYIINLNLDGESYYQDKIIFK